MSRSLIYSTAAVLLLIIGGYFYTAWQSTPGKVAESHRSIELTDSMRLTFQAAVLSRRGYESYLLALRKKDDDLIKTALEASQGALAAIEGAQVDGKILKNDVAPLIRENITLVREHGLMPDEAALEQIRKNASEIERLTQAIEKNIWTAFQTDFIEVETREQQVQLFYQWILVCAIVLSGVFLYGLYRQKKLNRDLLRTEAGLREAQALARLGNWDTDLRTGKSIWSEEEFRLLGFVPGKVEPSVETFMQCVHPDDKELVTRELQRATTHCEQEPYSVVHRALTPNGERLLEQQGRVEFSNEGKAIRLYGTTIDVTDVKRYQAELERYRDQLEDLVEERTRDLEKEIGIRKLAEEKLRKSEERTKLIVDTAPDGIVTMNELGVITGFNAAAESIFGYAASDAVGRNVSILMADISEERHNKYITDYLRDETKNIIGRRLELSAKRKSGEVFPIELSVSELKDKGERLFSSIIRDISERKAAENKLNNALADLKDSREEIEESEARLRQILESSTAGISILRRNPVRRVFANQHFLDMFGATSIEDVENAGKFRTFVNLEDGEASLARLEKGVPFFQVVIERKRLDGSRFWVLMDAASIEFEGAPATIVWHYDITDQKRAEQELVEARLEAKDKLFHRLTESLPAAVCQFQMFPDGRTRFPYASQGIRNLLEVSPDAVQEDASEAFSRIHPDDYDGVVAAIDASRTELNPIRKEFRVRLPEGGEKWLFTESVPEKLADESVLWHGYISDITDLKRSQSELERYRDHLEELVEERTHDLEREIEERRAAEAELQGSQERLRQILESADAGISIVQQNPVRRIYSNQRFLELFGVKSLDELDAAGHLATFASKSEGEAAVSRLERGEAFYRTIIQRQRLDGGAIWILMDSSPIEFEGKEATIVWHYDITDQKRAEDELVKARLEAKDQLLERLTERLQGMIYQFRMDPDGNTSFPYASQGIRQVYGVEPEEVRDNAAVVFSRIHPDDLAGVSDSVVESRDQLTPWRKEYRVCLPERGERWLYGDSVPEKQEDGSVLWHGYISDVTELKHSELELEKYRDKLEDLVEERTRDLEREIEERKAAQIELRKSEERHRGILDSSSAGISILRVNPVKRVYANQRFLELFHAESTDEMDAYGFKNTFVLESDHNSASDCVNKGMGFDRFIMERRCVDGSTWWGLHDAIPIEFEGAPATIVWHYDITDQKLAEKELVQSEKLASLGGLVAGIAHEVNTPIGVSVTAATYLEEKVSEITDQIADGNLKKRNLSTFLETAKESSAIITSNLHRASDLVRSFKQVAVDQSSEECRTFKVLDYFDEVVQSLHPQLKKTLHEITIQGDRSLVLTSYPGAMSQILTNLVMNSLTHAFDEGDAGHIRIEAKRNAKAAHISYRDDGKGVPPEALRHIFDPFFTTSRGTGGSGLGMNIVYNLVTQKLGGTVVCDSKLGEGISVHITVPYEQGEAE